MNTDKPAALDRRARVLRFLCHPLVIIAIIEFILLASTLIYVLTRS
jgi:hypothetical protein